MVYFYLSMVTSSFEFRHIVANAGFILPVLIMFPIKYKKIESVFQYFD